jgi:hypothetical protein
MSVYETSPECGGPEPSWRETSVILAAIVSRAGAIWAVRRLPVRIGVV